MIGIIGINHESAPLEIREKMAFSDEESIVFLKQLKENFSRLEAVLISTCNRFELYFSIEGSCSSSYNRKIISILMDTRKLDKEIESSFYFYSNYDAVYHLLRVAAGLDSMVLGENQILGQLKNAYRIGTENGMTKIVLNRLFHRAFEAGKKVRVETEINKGASSFGFAAVELVRKVFGEIKNNPVLMIGAGEMGELVVRSLAARGCRHILIINRTKKKAEDLSKKIGAVTKDFESMENALIESDIVISSTTAGKLFLDKKIVEKVMKKRGGKLFLLIDLSVPRNIDESVTEVRNTFLFNMDDIQQIIAYNSRKRRGTVKKAELIIERIADDFMSWKNSLSLSPTIESLKRKLFSYSETELSNLKRRISKEEYHWVTRYSDFITNKYLGLIIKNLKVLSKNGCNLEYIELVNNLFELETEPKTQEQNGESGGE